MRLIFTRLCTLLVTKKSWMRQKSCNGVAKAPPLSLTSVKSNQNTIKRTFRYFVSWNAHAEGQNTLIHAKGCGHSSERRVRASAIRTLPENKYSALSDWVHLVKFDLSLAEMLACEAKNVLIGRIFAVGNIISLISVYLRAYASDCFSCQIQIPYQHLARLAFQYHNKLLATMVMDKVANRRPVHLDLDCKFSLNWINEEYAFFTPICLHPALTQLG